MAHWWEPFQSLTSSDDAAPPASTILDPALQDRLARLLSRDPGSPPPSLMQAMDAYRQARTPEAEAPVEEKKPKRIGAWQTIKDLAGGMGEIVRGTPAVVASAMEGIENPRAEHDWKDRWIEDNQKRQQANIEALKASGEYDRPLWLFPGTRGKWAETAQSLPYSVATMGPAAALNVAGSLLGGAAGTAIGAPTGPGALASAALGAEIGGTIGSAIGAYIPAGHASANQYIRDSLDHYEATFKEKQGRAPTPEEVNTYYETTVKPQAQTRIFHGEAAPEAVGTAAEIGLMKSAAKNLFQGGGSIPTRLLKAGAKTALGAFAIEPATEALTQQIQQPAYSATGLTDEAPRSMTSMDDWGKSIDETYGPAAAISLYISALGLPIGAVYNQIQATRRCSPYRRIRERTR